MEDREEYLEKCKKRAMEYWHKGEYDNSVTSMLCDLQKHPEWKSAGKIMATMLIIYSLERTADCANRIINGFR